jgi:hypothetical protein
VISFLTFRLYFPIFPVSGRHLCWYQPLYYLLLNGTALSAAEFLMKMLCSGVYWCHLHASPRPLVNAVCTARDPRHFCRDAVFCWKVAFNPTSLCSGQAVLEKIAHSSRSTDMSDFDLSSLERFAYTNLKSDSLHSLTGVQLFSSGAVYGKKTRIIQYMTAPNVIYCNTVWRNSTLSIVRCAVHPHYKGLTMDRCPLFLMAAITEWMGFTKVHQGYIANTRHKYRRTRYDYMKDFILG